MTVQSKEQRMVALTRANVVRVAQAKLKREVTAGEVDWRDVLRDPPECARTMRVVQLLMAAPRVGSVKVDRALRTADVVPTKHVGSLTRRQVDVLCQLGRGDFERASPLAKEAERLRRELWAAQRENDRLSKALERMHNERAFGVAA